MGIYGASFVVFASFDLFQICNLKRVQFAVCSLQFAVVARFFVQLEPRPTFLFAAARCFAHNRTRYLSIQIQGLKYLVKHGSGVLPSNIRITPDLGQLLQIFGLIFFKVQTQGSHRVYVN